MGWKSPLVLVADDDPDVLELVAFRLRRSGCRVLVAANGRAALDAIVDRAPDVAVLDVAMPSLGGLEVCRLVRATASARSVGIVLLTARADEPDVKRGIGSGADAYVTKPFAWNELAGAIESVLERRVAPWPALHPTAA